jgi:hypothetical protein
MVHVLLRFVQIDSSTDISEFVNMNKTRTAFPPLIEYEPYISSFYPSPDPPNETSSPSSASPVIPRAMPSPQSSALSPPHVFASTPAATKTPPLVMGKPKVAKQPPSVSSIFYFIVFTLFY